MSEISKFVNSRTLSSWRRCVSAVRIVHGDEYGDIFDALVKNMLKHVQYSHIQVSETVIEDCRRLFARVRNRKGIVYHYDYDWNDRSL